MTAAKIAAPAANRAKTRSPRPPTLPMAAVGCDAIREIRSDTTSGITVDRIALSQRVPSGSTADAIARSFGSAVHAIAAPARSPARRAVRTREAEDMLLLTFPARAWPVAGQRRLTHGGGAHQTPHAHRFEGAARDQHQRAFLLQPFVKHVH